MQIELAARNAARGWEEIPDSCPDHIRARIIEKRSAMLNRKRANSAPAAPAVAPQRISDTERNTLAARLTNAIRLF